MILTLTDLRDRVRSRLTLESKRRTTAMFFDFIASHFSLNAVDELVYGVQRNGDTLPLNRKFVIAETNYWLHFIERETDYSGVLKAYLSYDINAICVTLSDQPQNYYLVEPR